MEIPTPLDIKRRITNFKNSCYTELLKRCVDELLLRRNLQSFSFSLNNDEYAVRELVKKTLENQGYIVSFYSDQRENDFFMTITFPENI